ncbi:metallophosphoesterase family protein [Psychromarinibacter sp. S121]|uniref:metallophosphoesterase family protein n=1 Tax=Psychromarinibacter sp. S121 TaxID=3415127 RepID=UPI003C7C91FE
MPKPKTDHFAAIADIHGNADALSAVLADIDARGIGTVVNLGDHFSGPLAAAETAEILLSRPMLSVRGNHDRYLIEHPPHQMHRSDAVAYRQLQPQHLDWLRSLPPTAAMGAGTGDGILLCHATPQDDQTYWLDEVRPDGSTGPRPLDGIRTLAGSTDARLILCGHTHLPRVVTLPGGPQIVNPGSVGLPAYDDDTPVAHVMQTGTPDASYAELVRCGDRWSVTIHSVPYESARMAALARDENREDWATALETGWLAV